MKEKKRLLTVLNGEKADRAPVICPGGMMSALVTELISESGNSHNLNAEEMAKMAKKIHEKSGFENYGVPFCMTVEAETFGVEVDAGSETVEPRVTGYSMLDIDDIINEKREAKIGNDRMKTVLEAISMLKNEDVPVIGNITGHISTASSVIDPLQILKLMRKDQGKLSRFLEYLNEYLVEYSLEMIKSGADVIVLSDPTATGEIIGRKNFELFALPMYQKLSKILKKLDIPFIIHICGKADNIMESLNQSGADALSFDSIVSMKNSKAIIKPRLMGNVSTILLHTGEKNSIETATKNCLAAGVDIVAPACGLSMATPMENLRIMTELVKRGEA